MSRSSCGKVELLQACCSHEQRYSSFDEATEALDKSPSDLSHESEVIRQGSLQRPASPAPGVGTVQTTMLSCRIQVASSGTCVLSLAAVAGSRMDLAACSFRSDGCFIVSGGTRIHMTLAHFSILEQHRYLWISSNITNHQHHPQPQHRHQHCGQHQLSLLASFRLPAGSESLQRAACLQCLHLLCLARPTVGLMSDARLS